MPDMIFLQAALLGLVEGLTEFLPVSSTGHLILLGDVLGFEGPPGKVFEIIIQLGAILAVCWLYRQKLIDTVLGFFVDATARRFAIAVVLAFLPAAVLGVMFHKIIKSVLFSPLVVSISLVVGGVLILLIERMAARGTVRHVDDIDFPTALKIGLCQALAMIPGVSRSGATIMGARLFGVQRAAATEFSFFLAIPTMIGATVYDGYKNFSSIDDTGFAVIAVGFVVAFLSALLVVKVAVAFISRHGFGVFAWYRILLGGTMLFILLR